MYTNMPVENITAQQLPDCQATVPQISFTAELNVSQLLEPRSRVNESPAVAEGGFEVSLNDAQPVERSALRGYGLSRDSAARCSYGAWGCHTAGAPEY